MLQKPKFWIGVQGLDIAHLAKWADAGANLFFGCGEVDWQRWRDEVRRLGCFYTDVARDWADVEDPHCLGWFLEPAYRFNRPRNRPFLPDLLEQFAASRQRAAKRPDWWLPGVFDGHAWAASMDPAGDAGGLVQDVMKLANVFITCLYPHKIPAPANIMARTPAEYLTRLMQIRAVMGKDMSGSREPWLVMLECSGSITPEEIRQSAQEAIKAGASGIIWNASNHEENQAWIGDLAEVSQFHAAREVCAPLAQERKALQEYPPAVTAPTLAQGWENRLPEVVSTMARELTDLRAMVEDLQAFRNRIASALASSPARSQNDASYAATLPRPQGNVEWGNRDEETPRRPAIQGVKK